MVNIIDQFGQNAGKIWRTLKSNGALTKKEVIKETNISLRDFYAAIGWLARENKIFQNGEFFAIDENDFNKVETNHKLNIEKTSSEKIFETIEAVNTIKDQETNDNISSTKIVNELQESDLGLIDQAISNSSLNFEKINPAVDTFLPKQSFNVIKPTASEPISNVENDVKINNFHEENNTKSVMKNDSTSEQIFEKKDNVSNSNISDEYNLNKDAQKINRQTSENSFLKESIEKINKVSRMTPDHLTFKEKSSLSEEMSPWNLPQLQRGTCDLCKETIEFENNLSGLTIGGNFFACENCCKDFSKEELTSWTKSKMKSPSEVRPIGLWVIQEKNKDRSVLSKK